MYFRPITIGVVCVLLAACSTFRNGYPNHVTEPSLAGPSKPATDNKTMYLDLIQQMQQQGAYYASLAHIDAFRLRYGDPPELQRLQADALRETGQNAEATKAYQSLLHSDQSAAAWHGLGLIAATDSQYAQAEQDLQQAVQLEPINVTYLGDLGYARLAGGQITAAREPLAQAAELAPTDNKAISNLALWALMKGDNAQADAIMQRGHLPPATCAAIQKLAIQLHTATQARSVAQASSNTTNPAATDHATSSSSSTQVAGIPGTLLDRFGTSSPSSEARP